MLSIYELQQRPETNIDNSPIIFPLMKWLLWWNIEIIKSKYADVYTNLYCIIPKSLMLGIEIFSYFSYSDCSWEMSNGMLSTELCSFWVCLLQWRHNERNGVSNHRRLYGLLNRLFRRSLKHQTSKFRVTGLCEGNSRVTGVGRFISCWQPLRELKSW